MHIDPPKHESLHPWTKEQVLPWFEKVTQEITKIKKASWLNSFPKIKCELPHFTLLKFKPWKHGHDC